MNRLAHLLEGRTRLALIAGGLMWLIWAAGSALGPGNLDLNGQVIGTDHTAFHTAAALIADDRGAALFDYPELTEFRERQEAITAKPGFLDPYRNPPFYALLYLPTARLDYLPAFGIWAVLGLFCLIGGLWLVRGRIEGVSVGWALSFYPTFAAVSFGQNTLLSFGVFALVCRCLTTDRRFLAGMAAGLLLYKPQLLFGLGIWWLLGFRRYWTSLMGVAATGAVLLAVSLILLPDESREWVGRLPDIAKYDAFEFFNLHNSRGFGALLTGNKSMGDVLGLLGMALGAAWLAWFWWRHGSNAQLMLAAAVFATLWGSPHTMTYEWALAILPAVIFWDSRPDLRATWVPLFALAWIVLFVSTPLTKGQIAVAGIAVQLSVPVLAFVGLRAQRALR